VRPPCHLYLNQPFTPAPFTPAPFTPALFELVLFELARVQEVPIAAASRSKPRSRWRVWLSWWPRAWVGSVA